MNRIAILGDSNVYRNVTADRLAAKLNCQITLLNTTRLTTLESRLKELTDDDHDIVFISCLGNIISDFGRGLEEEDLPGTIGKAVSDYVGLIASTTGSKKKVMLAHPFYRSEPKWFVDVLLLAKDRLSKDSSQHANMLIIPEFRVTGVDLAEDGVHLVPDAGFRYSEHLISCIRDVISSPMDEGDSCACSSGSQLLNKTDPTNADIMNCLHNVIMPRLDELAGVKNRLDQLERKILVRLAADDVEQARDREEVDNLRNDCWRDRVMVSGLEVEELPAIHADQKNALATLFRDLVEKVLGEMVYDVYPKRDGRLINSKVSAFEIRFPSVSACDKFKSQAYKLVKEECFSKLSMCTFSHKVTLGTRIRTEILRAISKKLNSKDESGYCPIHNPRPILQVGPLKDNKVVPNRTLTFVDAVLTYRHLLSVNDLKFAYSRVGSNFSGSLVRTFLVLNEEDRPESGRVIPTTFPGRGGMPTRGQKRKFEDPSRSGGRGGKRGK